MVEITIDDIKSSNWFAVLGERQQKEIVFACVYASEFSHGTDGHHRLRPIALMAELAARLYPWSDRTLRYRLGRLEERGMVTRPEGERSGWCVVEMNE
jgi:hypothetical protein